jgi:HEAT repeat protein
MALLQKDPEELRRVQAQALQGEPIPRRVFEAALLDPNTEVRLAALYEISLTFDETPLDLVAPVLQGDPNAEVRLEALSMIAEVENKEADALIESALDDPDEGVSSEAQDVLESRIEVSE